MAQYAANKLSKEWKTKVKVRNVSFTLLNHVNLEGLYIEDRKQDTLFTAGQVQLNITDWFFLKDSIDIKYVGLKDARIYLQRTTDSIWNYQFIADYFAGDPNKPKAKKTPADTTGKGITLNLRNIDLQNLVLEQRDKFRGKTTVLGIGNFDFTANKIDLENSIYDLDYVTLAKLNYAEFRYKGLWSYDDSVAYRRRLDALPPGGGFPENPGNIELHIGTLNLTDGSVEFKSRNASPSVQGEFNTDDIAINSMTGIFRNIRWNQDTFRANIDMVAKSREGLPINKLKTDFTMHPKLMELKNLDLQLNESRLTDYFSMQYGSMDDFDDFENKVTMTGNFENAVVSIKDVAFFAPALKSTKQKVSLTGYVTGPLKDLEAKKFKLQTNGTNVQGSLRLTGLPYTEKLYIDFTTPGSVFQLSDVAVWAPALLDFGPGLKQGLATTKFKGSFTGLADNFKLKGDIGTSQGILATDLKMNLANNIYDGKVSTTNLNLGNLLGVKDLGKLTFDGNITGKGFDATTAKMLFEGHVKSAFYNNYTYQDVKAKGTLEKSILNAHLEMNDSNLTGVIDATLDIKAKKQSYIGTGNLTKANFKALNFTDKDLKFSGAFDVNFSGRSIDDFLGYAKIHDAHVSNGDVPFQLDSLNIYSNINEDGKKELEIQTNQVDASIVGKFNIADLPNSFQYFLSNYYPTIIAKPKRAVKNQDFIFAVNTKEIEGFLKLIDQKIEGLSNSSIIGTINTNDNQLLLNASIPYFKYDNFLLDSANIQGNGSLTRLDLLGSVSAFRFSDSLSFYNAQMSISTENNLSQIKITTSSEGQIGEAKIDAVVTAEEDGVKLKFNPSDFVLNNKKWTISQDGELIYKNNKQLIANNIILKNDDQEIGLYTLPNEEHPTNDIHIYTKKLNIGDLLPYVLKDPRLEGTATGKFTIVDPMGQPRVFIDSLTMNEFRLNGDSIGVVNASGSLITATGKGRFTLESPNKAYDFKSTIDINLKDSTGNQIVAPIVFKHTRINILNNYLNTIFDDIDGYASGTLTLKGKFSQPEMIGDIRMDSARIKVAFTKVTYYIDSGVIQMRPGYMGFDKMKLRDRFNNYGVLDGGFKHHFFNDMSFDLKVNSDRMELLNTTFRDNPAYYGTAIGKGSFDLQGPANNLNIKIGAEPTDSSHVAITSSTSRESDQADYIVVKKYGTEQVAPKTAEQNLLVDVDLKVNNKAQIDVVLDAASGDMIKARGNGRIHIVLNNENMTLKNSRFNIESGNYDYSFQSFIRKGFNLAGENNYVVWQNDDPLDATLNIDAIYTAKNVRFSDLNGSDNKLGLNKTTAAYKGDINVVAKLRGSLNKPRIEFLLDFPSGSTLKNDPSADIAIQRINNNPDQSELLKQVTYLIVFNQFAPYGESKGARNPTTDLAVNTMSELLSREMGKILSNVLYQITGDRSWQVDFSTSFYSSADVLTGNVSSTTIDRTNVNLKISGNLFNPNIIFRFGSDFDISLRNTSVNSFQFLPDFRVEFILNASKKLRAILFKKDNLELGLRQNRIGGSISYRQDFERLFGKAEKDTTSTILKAPPSVSN